ncbi:MAG: carbohydrate ABC transporter permease [Bacteroidota bacterium]
MRFRKSPLEILFDVTNTLVLLGITLATLYPLLYVLFGSLSDPVAMARSGALLLYPKDISFDAYRMVFTNEMIAYGYRNTFILVTLGTSINFLLTVTAAYALSRKTLPGQRILMLGMVFTMQFSGGLIPTYLLVTQGLGLMNSYWAVLLPTAINTMNLIIMRTFFAGVPPELEESARLDGANDFAILFRIFIPVSKPVIATVVLFYAVAHWNDFFHALIYLRERTLYPLQLVLREILIQHSTDSMTTMMSQDQEQISENMKYATIIVATVPILFLYPFLQKYFVKGVMIGSLKQ